MWARLSGACIPRHCCISSLRRICTGSRDAIAEIDRGGFKAADIEGGGPIEDLANLGLGLGWHGTAKVQIKELKALFSGAAISAEAAVGNISVADLASPRVAGGANWGGYALHFADPVINPDSAATAELSDSGGPLSVNALISYFGKERRATLSGTVAERADAPPALHRQLDNLAQLHPRDAQGRIPVDLEFTL
jgi:hypothetical protein